MSGWTMLAVPSTGAQVRPCFQVVRLRNVPGRKRRRFVSIASDVETERGFSRLLGKFQVRRRVVARIGPDHDERVDDARTQGRASVRTSVPARRPPAVRSTGSIRSTGACNFALIQWTSACASGESARPASTSARPGSPSGLRPLVWRNAWRHPAAPLAAIRRPSHWRRAIATSPIKRRMQRDPVIGLGAC